MKKEVLDKLKGTIQRVEEKTNNLGGMQWHWAFRDEVTKAKVQLQLNVARNVKDNKGFYKYLEDKRKARENVGPLLNETEDLMT